MSVAAKDTDEYRFLATEDDIKGLMDGQQAQGFF